MEIAIPYGKYKGCDIEDLLKDSRYVKWIVDHMKNESDFYTGVLAHHYADLYEQPITGKYLDKKIASAIKLRGSEFLTENGFKKAALTMEKAYLDIQFLNFVRAFHAENASIAGKFLSYFYRFQWDKLLAKKFIDSDVEAMLEKYEHVEYSHDFQHMEKVKKSYELLNHSFHTTCENLYNASTCYFINRYGTHNTNHEKQINLLICDNFKINTNSEPGDFLKKILIFTGDLDKSKENEFHEEQITSNLNTNPVFIFGDIKAEIDVIYKDSIFVFKTVKKIDAKFMELYLMSCASIINKCDSKIIVRKAHVVDLYNQNIYTFTFDNLNTNAILKTLEIA